MDNFKNLMIGISELRNTLSEVINERVKRIVVKNNKPVSILIPYEEYKTLEKQAKESKEIIGQLGQDITLDNGVQVMVTVSKGDLNEGGLDIKTYVKMKTSGNYKLHFTQHLSNPSVESTYTNEELIDRMKSLYKEDEEVILIDKDKESEEKYEVDK